MVVMVPVVSMLLVLVFLLVVILFLVRALDLVYPGCGCSHLVEVEPACVQDAVQVNVAEVALYDFRLRLERLDDAPYPSQLLRAHFRRLVQEYDVAEFYLLYDEFLEVVIVEIAQRQGIPAAEFALHPQGVYHGHDAVQLHLRPARAV